MIDFLFVIIELWRYLVRLRRYKRKSVEVGVFQREMVNLSANFRRKGASTTNRKKTRVIALSCGIKIGGAENAGVENAGVDSRVENAKVQKAGAITYGRPSEQKTLKTP